MAKKKAAKRKTKAQPKTRSVPKKVAAENIIDSETKMFEADITAEGTLIGTIKAPMYEMHKMALIAINESNDSNNYFGKYADMLTEKFGFQISETAAYKIANIVFDQFEVVKKNTTN